MRNKLHYCFSIFFLRLLLPVCTLFLSSYSRQDDKVKLIEASYEKRNNGINHDRAGSVRSEYYFKIKALSKDKITFDSLWMNDAAFKTYLSANRGFITDQAVTFTKNDTVTVRVSETNTGRKSKCIAPIQYVGAALLRYYVNNKPFFLIIKSIQFNDSPNRP